MRVIRFHDSNHELSTKETGSQWNNMGHIIVLAGNLETFDRNGQQIKLMFLC